jgi:hypothetical protein
MSVKADNRKLPMLATEPPGGSILPPLGKPH